MFQIKICGITTVIDALATAQAGADAIGLNFFAGSKRYVTPERAAEIAQSLPSNVVKVGVFVNALEEDIRRAMRDTGLDAVQMHGDEPPSFLARLGDMPVIRAFRLGNRGLPAVDAYLAECEKLGSLPRMILLDACVAGQYGGTGVALNWPMLGSELASASRPPWILAGGLGPSNVADAIRLAHPAAVDTAGGVEYAPGRKDHTLVAAFVASARAAMSE